MQLIQLLAGEAGKTTLTNKINTALLKTVQRKQNLNRFVSQP